MGHARQNFKELKRLLPHVDRGIANLIDDLHDRGMEDDVVTVMWGEFGRTPKINIERGPRPLVAGDERAGRRRRAEDGSGGRRQLREGRVPEGPAVQGAAPAQHDLPRDGHRPGMTFPNGSGRPMYILDDREPVKELIG